ncbi:MAG: hypothetical protein AVDCRST_MAG68-2141 [uncultured Gemmatimonadetes bacterium]|uniref:NlpC/P60 domain-containing protein n=1 Tax=uncultured Gemmatimonadota bacterium TaxID=203437 RepID=A0A6J4L6G4_9BACT|nr:MAG: hypothetical protein AVDCRST_MAG68-2141 [uncultured Gemmatimonadota bacterium]
MPAAGLAPFELSEIVLDGRALDLAITGRVTSVAPKRTISGASTVVVTVADRDGVVQRSGILDRAADLKLPADDGTPLWFRLASDATDEEGLLTLTFESRVWARLAEKTRPRSMRREDVTAAEFLLALVREVKAERIPFICRRLHVRQRVAEVNSTEATSPSQRRDRGRDRGLADDARVTVKGKAATSQQRRVIAGCLEEANRLGASPFVMVAVVMCITQESGAGALANVTTGNDDVGIYQQGRNWISVKGSKDPEASTKAFLVTGPTSWQKVHGSIKTRSGDRESMLKRVQGSVGGYAPWEAEAKRIVAAFGVGPRGADGPGGIPSDGDREPDVEDYRFRRGQGGERESTTACGLRLAEERNWRFFESGGAIYFDSDETLMRSRPRMTVTPTTVGLVSLPSHSRDVGHKVQQITFKYRAIGWGAPPGSVVLLEGWGAAKDGRWLVEEISKDDVRSLTATVTLTRAQRAKLEPPAEQKQSAASGPQGGGSQGARGARSRGSQRDRIVAAAKATLTSKTGFSRYSLTGALTSDPTPRAPARTDCSQWIRAIYLQAGAPDPGTYTGAMLGRGRATSSPRPGDILVGTSHCELFIGDGKTIGHGSAPIDYSTVAYWRARGLTFRTYLDD